jgi:hypothetical protein
MATILKAGNVASGAQITSDATGILEIKTGTGAGTTAITVGTNQAVTFAAGTTINGITVGRGGGDVATNTAVGASALAATTGSSSNNTAVGSSAGAALTSGARNTALGFNALLLNTTGAENTAVGGNALNKSTTASGNTGLGYVALYETTTGANNTAVGLSALQNNTTASNNTAVGYQAGFSNTTGTNNTILGGVAGYTNQTGSNNVFIGREAGYATTGSGNTFVGRKSNSTGCGEQVTTGANNLILGGFSGNQNGLDIRTSSNNIVISDGDGNPYLFWRNSSATWFFGSLASGAGTNTLKWNTSTGAITYDTSSVRYKDNIRDSVYGLSHVMQMRSAQFEYKDSGRSDVGLIAEELDSIIPELVGKNKDGEPDSVSYDRMVSVLVKAIQELKAEVDALKGQS